MSEEEAYAWQEIRLPHSVMSVGSDSGTLHYLEIEDKWTVFIHEPEPMVYEDDEGFEVGGHGHMVSPGCPMCPAVRWTVAFQDNEVAAGVLVNVPTAKRIALTILEALEKGPPPEVPQSSGPRAFGGSRRGGH